MSTVMITRLSVAYLLKSVMLVTSLSAASALAMASDIAVLVIDFDSSMATPWRDTLPEMIDDRLINEGDFAIVDRDRDRGRDVVEELKYQTQSGFVDPETAVQIGNQLGARLLVSGSILEDTQSSKTSSAYGLQITSITTQLKARMEVLDISTGRKIYSRIASAVDTYQETAGLDTSSKREALGESVAQKLVDGFISSRRYKDLVPGIKPETSNPGGDQSFAITVTSEPPGADVEIDGVFYGSADSTPFSVAEGQYVFKVTLAGYTPWVKTIRVSRDLSLRARLAFGGS